jgi:hypothetical protein
MTHAEQVARDQHGRFRRGVSGNKMGRPRGSKNRHPRRRADLERTGEWTASDWLVLYRRTYHSAAGSPPEKHGAAFANAQRYGSYSIQHRSVPGYAPTAAGPSTCH